MTTAWEYDDFASIITPEALALNARGFRVTRTREFGASLFHVVGTYITSSTWMPEGERSEEEAFLDAVARLQRELTRSLTEQEADARAIDAAQKLYQAQYAYACGYRD